MTWKDYQLKIQLAKTPQQFQAALTESVLALLNEAQAKEDARSKQDYTKPISRKVIADFVLRIVKFSKRKKH